VTVCEKIVPRLNKHNDRHRMKFHDNYPTYRNEELVAPLPDGNDIGLLGDFYARIGADAYSWTSRALWRRQNG